MARRQRAHFPLHWFFWWLLLKPSKIQSHSQALYFDEYERDRPQTTRIPSVQKGPAKPAPSPTPTAMAPAKPVETKKTPKTPAKSTSATPNKRPLDEVKDAATSSNAHLTKKQRKQLRRAEAQQATPPPEHQEFTHSKEKSPTRRRPHSSEKAPTPHSSTEKSKHATEEAQDSKRVHFAMGVKTEDAPSRMSVPSPGSSYASYTDPSRKGLEFSARDRKPALKNKANSGNHPTNSTPKIPHAAISEINFEDIWSNGSDGEGSAVDVSEFAGATVLGRNPGLPGILKTGGRKASSIRPHTYSGIRKYGDNVHLSRAEPMAFTLKDLQRAKHSGYGPAAVHAISREKRNGTSSSSRNHYSGDGPTDSWSGDSNHESAVDNGHSRSRKQARSQDDRLKAALEQAQANKKVNSGLSRHTPREQMSRSAFRSTQQQTAPVDSSSSVNGGLRPTSSSRPEPIFVFKPSDAKEKDPGIVVHNQAELEAAMRDYWRRRTSSSSLSRYSKKGSNPSRFSYVESDSDSDSD